MAKRSSQSDISRESQVEAEAIARANQRPGQTKEQTRLIAQGIEKGIAQYKKQQKAKAREADKLRKKRQQSSATPTSEPQEVIRYRTPWLPWGLVLISWAGFITYLFTQ